MSASQPTPEELASARWFGGKAGSVRTVAVEDRLELGGGAALSILAVDGGERYLWTEGAVAAAIASTPGPDPGVGDWRIRHTIVTGAGRGHERPIGIDQSNTSYVVDERLVVKLYRRVWPGTHPEIELVAHLTGRVASVPAFAGSIEWRGCGIGLVQEYVAGGRDGWEWAGDAVIAGEVAAFARLGTLTAELHAALAELGVKDAGPAVRRAWRSAAEAQLERALAIVPPDVASALRDAEGWIRTHLGRLDDPALPATLQRVHGDYHIGQILAAGDRLVVLDFEGEPTKPVAERAAPGTPVRDVAAMLRSFDHLGRYVARERWPGHEAEIDAWIDRARAAFLAGYGPVDPVLLRAVEVEKACYEFTYAAQYAPAWMYAPAGGLRWLEEHDG